MTAPFEPHRTPSPRGNAGCASTMRWYSPRGTRCGRLIAGIGAACRIRWQTGDLQGAASDERPCVMRAFPVDTAHPSRGIETPAPTRHHEPGHLSRARKRSPVSRQYFLRQSSLRTALTVVVLVVWALGPAMSAWLPSGPDRQRSDLCSVRDALASPGTQASKGNDAGSVPPHKVHCPLCVLRDHAPALPSVGPAPVSSASATPAPIRPAGRPPCSIERWSPIVARAPPPGADPPLLS